MEYKSERERDEQKKRELIELKKVEHGQIENIYAKQREQQPPPPPPTPRQKRENFWYHHKGKVIAITAVVLIVCYFVYDFLSTPKYDAMVILACENSLSLYQETFENDLALYSEDYNSDGKKLIGVSVVVIRPSDSADARNEFSVANKAKLAGLIAAGEHLIYILDDTSYNHIKEGSSNIFQDLSKNYPNNSHVKGDRFYIKGTEFEKYLLSAKKEYGDLQEIPEDLSISIRDTSLMNDEHNEKYKKDFENQKKLFYNIIEKNK